MNDPSHWLEASSGSTELERSVLGAGLDERVPSGAEESVWAKLMVALGPMPAPGGTGGPSTTGPTGALGAAGKLTAVTIKAFGVGALSGAVALSASYALISHRQVQPATSSSVVRASIPHSPPQASEAPPCSNSSRIELQDLALMPSGTAAAKGAVKTAEPSSASRVAVRFGAQTRPEVESTALPSAATTGASPLKQEAGMLSEARSRLGHGDLIGASKALEVMDSRFPQGALLQEREALRVALFYRRGQVGAARERAREFLRRYPNSPHAAEFERLAAGR